VHDGNCHHLEGLYWGRKLRTLMGTAYWRNDSKDVLWILVGEEDGTEDSLVKRGRKSVIKGGVCNGQGKKSRLCRQAIFSCEQDTCPWKQAFFEGRPWESCRGINWGRLRFTRLIWKLYEKEKRSSTSRRRRIRRCMMPASEGPRNY